jgi:hypothetical protein
VGSCPQGATARQEERADRGISAASKRTTLATISKVDRYQRPGAVSTRGPPALRSGADT